MKLQAFLPLVTHADPNADAIAENAVAAAVWLGATLHARALNARITAPTSALSGILMDVPALIRDAESASRKHGARLLEKVAAAAARQGVSLTSETEAGPIAMLGEQAAANARYYDLAMAGWEAGNQTSRMTAEALIFGAGRPVLVLPELAPRQEFASVAIAWDGTRTAARAVGDALPFLQRASRIAVLTVVGEKRLAEASPGRRLAEGLRHRGFVAEELVFNAEDCPVAVTLQDRAIAAGADLLVMGGYGHSRIRDFVLGGATQGTLDDLRMPVLMSH
ncbi:MAG TPA: universal stress protein [Rhizobiaceae bacterium]